MKKSKILFVYNADSGIFNAVLDSYRKITSSSKVCTLCSLTYGTFTIKKDWKEFVKNLGIMVEFLHKDEFFKQYNMDIPLPSVFLKKGSELNLIISDKDINKCQSLNDLTNLVTKKVDSFI